MNRMRWSVVTGSLVILVLMLLFPPYYETIDWSGQHIPQGNIFIGYLDMQPAWVIDLPRMALQIAMLAVLAVSLFWIGRFPLTRPQIFVVSTASIIAIAFALYVPRELWVCDAKYNWYLPEFYDYSWVSNELPISFPILIAQYIVLYFITAIGVLLSRHKDTARR